MAIPLKDAHNRAVHYFNTQCTSYVKPYAFSSESIRSVREKKNIPKYQKEQEWFFFNKNPKTFGYLKRRRIIDIKRR